MPVLRSYKCPRHGYFDAWEPVCEQGCTDVAQVILKAPSMRDSTRTRRSKTADDSLKNLALDFKMTDIKSTREGEFQEGYLTRNNAPPPQEARPGDNLLWGNAGRFSMSSVLAGGAVKSVAGEKVGFSPKDAEIKRGPIASSYVADHEGLKIT